MFSTDIRPLKSILKHLRRNKKKFKLNTDFIEQKLFSHLWGGKTQIPLPS